MPRSCPPSCLLVLVALLGGCSDRLRYGPPAQEAGCPPGSKCDSPGEAAPSGPLAGSVGRCVPFAPYPGYNTCLMSEPQMPPDPGASQLQPFDVLPASVDHRADYLGECIEVHSQGSCGWCTAHATTAALEARLCQGKLAYRRISEPHLWWLGKERGTFTDCKGGWYISSAFFNLGYFTDKGYLLVRGALWPYTDNLAQMNASKPSDTTLFKQGEHGAHSSQVGSVAKKDVDALKQALAAGHDVVYSVPTFKGVGWKWWDAGYGDITAPTPAPPGLCNCDDCPKEPHCRRGYHAILITGYDDTTGRFQFLNSWGAIWGHSGFGTLDYATVSDHGQGGRYAKQLKLSPAPVAVPDAAMPDSAVPDAAVPDAAVPDAAVPDSAAPQPPDGGVPDTSSPSDAAPEDVGTPPPNGGASCAAPALLPLVASPTVVSGDTTGAPNEFGLKVTCGSEMTYDAPQRYYRVSLVAGASYSFKVTPTGHDVALYAYPASTSCAAQAVSQQCQGHLADAWGGITAEQLVLQPATDGDWVVVVDGFDPAASGPFQLSVTW